MLSYVIPTRDRPERLRETLQHLAALGHAPGEAEVIVVDNDSRERLVMPRVLPGGLPLRTIHLNENRGAAARNIGAVQSNPASRWVVMLDDDSHPLDLGHVAMLEDQPEDVGAVSADIFLPPRQGARRGPREAGGLPEVFIGCGVALRRDLFLALGGYDESMGYYAEEYDLAARMILHGRRVVFEPRFRVLHAKVTAGRHMDTILSRLVRNNGWVAQRYAPEPVRWDMVREARRRYRAIARKEGALQGYGAGLVALRQSLRRQTRAPLNTAQWDRFTGLAAAREGLQHAFTASPFRTAALCDLGKNSWVVARALQTLGVRVLGDGEDADVTVIGTMSPGPMLDALERLCGPGRVGQRVLAPWLPARPAPRLERDAA